MNDLGEDLTALNQFKSTYRQKELELEEERQRFEMLQKQL